MSYNMSIFATKWTVGNTDNPLYMSYNMSIFATYNYSSFR